MIVFPYIFCYLCRQKQPNFISRYMRMIIMQCKLTIISGENEGFSMTLHEKNLPVIIGRGKNCGLRLEDSKVSGKHCKIFYEEKKLWLTDLDSTNGLLLNGHKLKNIKELKNGDQIGIGLHILNVDIIQDSVNVPPRFQDTEMTQAIEDSDVEDYNKMSDSIYEITETLEEKGNLVIAKGVHKIHENVVLLKTYTFPDISPENKQSLNLGLKRLKNLQNQCILSLFDFYWNDDHQLTLVYDFIQGRNLVKIIESKKRLSDRKAVKIAINIAAGLYYLHSEKKYHGGLSAWNVIIEDGTRAVKLSDVGVYSLFLSHGLVCNSLQSDVQYFVPNQEHHYRPVEIDLFGIGSILLYLITGTFTKHNMLDTLLKLLPDTINPQLREFFSQLFLQKISSAKECYTQLREILKYLEK